MAPRRIPVLVVAGLCSMLLATAMPAAAVWQADPISSPDQRVGTTELEAVTGVVTQESSDGLVVSWDAAHDEAEYTVTREIGDTSVPIELGPGDHAAIDPLTSALTRVREISAGINHSCALDSSGQAWCWGNNGFAELGIGIYNGFATSPGSVHGSHRFASLSSGDRHTCAIDEQRRAWCWGTAASGRLGDGPANASGSTPVPVAGGHAFRQVSAGATHSCGVTTENRAWCWGDNASGQLGTGSAGSPAYGPVSVVGDTQFTHIAAGDNYTCAIATDGHLWCWGDNAEGQLGFDKAEVSSLSAPGPVDSAPQFTALSAGTNHACGVNPQQEIWCWGSNASGQLGRAGTDGPPAPVVGGPPATIIEAGYTHTCAASDTGTWCWGNNVYGKLGVWPLEPVSASEPLPLPSIAAPSLAIGAFHGCAVVGDGAQCWGMNLVGQLGTGSSAWTQVPADVDLVTGCPSRWQVDPDDPAICRPEPGTSITYSVDYAVRGWTPETASTVTVIR